MSLKHGTNRFFPRSDGGGGGGGADLWTLYGGTVVGLTTLTDTVSIGTNAMLADEKLLVAGGIAATPTIAGNDAFVQVGSGDSTVLSGANSFRLIYNAGTAQAEISTNGGVFVPLASGGASPWTAAAGVITEVVPANLVVVGSAAALTADQFQVLGNSTLRAAADSNATFAVEDSATNAIFQVDTINNASVVTGSYQMSSGITAEVYLESGPSTAANAGVGAGRLRYHNAGTPAWEVSVNGGGYSNLITAATLPATAFVQSGNSFGADAILGTNDGFALQFETSGTTKARITTGGALLVGTAAATAGELLNVAGSAYLSDARLTGATGYLESVSSTAAVSNATEGRIRYSNGSLAWQASVNGGAYSDLITASTLPATAFVQSGNSFGADAVLGTNDAFALQFETSGTTKARITTGGALLVGTAAATASELLNVAGSAYVSNARLTSATGYLESVSSTAAVSNAAEGRLRYNNTALAWQVSVNGGAYADLLTSSALASAFVQNGNTFGANATLGTNDNFALIFETNGTARGRFLNTGEFVINGVSAGNEAILTANRTYASGTGTTKYATYFNTIVNTLSDTGAVYGQKTELSLIGAINAVTLGGYWIETGHKSTGTISTMYGLRVFSRGADAIALGTVSSNFGLAISHGYYAFVTSGAFGNSYGIQVTLDNVSAARTITNAWGIQIGNHGATGVTNAYGIDIATQSGAATNNISLRVQGNAVVGGTVMSGSEALRVTGNGFRSDGTSHVVAVSSTLSINNSGGAINIGDAANAQPINIGTGVAARTISIGTAAAAFTINIGSTNTTSSIANSFGTNGFGLIQGAASAGTPIGVLMTAGAHTGLNIAEVTDVNFNLSRTVTFGAGGGTLASQRAYRIQGPTYAAAAALTITDVATLAVTQPTPGANVTLSTGATGPTMPTDSGASGGAYSLTQTPAVRVEGVTANTTLGVAMIFRNTASNATAFPVIGWQSNAGALDGTIGFQCGNAFNHQRFALTVRANGVLFPALTISSQGGYRFSNSAPNDPATTPAGFLFTGTANGAVNTYTASSEARQFTIDSNQTYTFATGAITTQRSAYIQAPTYAFSAASTITDTATLAINSAPVPGANATFTRSMALWVQAGVARFDGGVGVKVTPGGTTVQGLAADFRKTNDPGSVSYPAGVSTVSGGAYTPATGYLSIIPAFWTLPAAINSGGGIGPPLNPGIRFNWSDGTTTIRYNTSTASSLTETRDAIDFNKDGLAIVGVDFIVNNTSGGAATVDFTAWTVDGNQF